jgi:hypothetical protein
MRGAHYKQEQYVSLFFSDQEITFSADITFNNKPEDQQKTTDLSQVTDKLDHIMLYTSP